MKHGHPKPSIPSLYGVTLPEGKFAHFKWRFAQRLPRHQCWPGNVRLTHNLRICTQLRNDDSSLTGISSSKQTAAECVDRSPRAQCSSPTFDRRACRESHRSLCNSQQRTQDRKMQNVRNFSTRNLLQRGTPTDSHGRHSAVCTYLRTPCDMSSTEGHLARITQAFSTR